MITTFEQSPQRYARWAGVLYLIIIALGLFGEVLVRGTLVVSGDATATFANISREPLLWRAGIAGDLLMHVLDIPTIWFLYLLLKPVSHRLALLATLFNLIQTAVLVVNKLTLLFPLFLLEDLSYLNVFSAPQLHALSQLAIKAHGYGFAIGLIFFGFACLVRGYLIFESDYFPKVLGVLLLAAGLCYGANSFALLLAPSVAALIFPAVLLPAFLGEPALAVWLVVKGVEEKNWSQKISSQRASDHALLRT